MLTSLVTKSIIEGDSTYLRKLPKEVLLEWERDEIQGLLDYEDKYGTLPDEERFKTDGTWSKWFNPSLNGSPFEDLLDQTIKHKKTERTRLILDEIDIDLNDSSIDNVVGRIDHLSEFLHGVNNSPKPISAVNLSERKDLFVSPPKDLMPIGLDVIDDATGGLRSGTVGCLFARPKVGKTTTLCMLATKQMKLGKKCLFISLEMMPNLILERIDAIVGGFNPFAFPSGDVRTTSRALSRVQAEYSAIEKAGGDIVIPVGINNVSSLDSFIRNDLKQTGRPFDWVYIDGVYLMEGVFNKTQDWRKDKEVVEGLQQMVMKYTSEGHPMRVFFTTQSKRGGGYTGELKEDEVAYTDAISQTVSLLLGMMGEPNSANSSRVDIIHSRFGASNGSTRLVFHWNKMRIEEEKFVNSGVTVVNGKGSK